jgi:hypothetical protein
LPASAHLIVIFPSKLGSGLGENTTPMNITLMGFDLDHGRPNYNHARPVWPEK